MSESYEAVIVGAGLTGACAAALLARHAGIAPNRVALLCPQMPPPLLAHAPPELRVAAISRASERVLAAAGAWQRLDMGRVCAYERMRVWHESAMPDGAAVLGFDAADVGEPNLGYIAEMSALQHACIASFVAAGGALIAASLERLVIDDDAARLDCGARQLDARLVIGADGVQSVVRAGAGLAVRTHDYQQLAIVATIETERSHDCTAWQRFLHTGPLALLPLFDGRCSIVWSLDLPAARGLTDCAASEFEARLDEASARSLGATRLASERASFPLCSVAAHGYVVSRCALIGDAAHVIHPLAGQGANLGLLDAAALCEAVGAAAGTREDPGALRLLRRYEQQRRSHNIAMDAAMSVLQRGFAGARGPFAALLNQGLRLVNGSQALKRALARQALGTAGELPRLARGLAA
jgi:ubiquinone biosynthesis UbiH/UbiF/VisC/COQ6 family hydroxylase